MASTSVSESPSLPIDSPGSTDPYDVFLSFTSLDTKEFTSLLRQELIMAGLHTFTDDSQLHIGREIPPQLMRAIEESKTHIVVFSEKYAYSKWCLDELVKMVDQAARLIPIFYGVQPLDVRWQRGNFEEPFRNHEVKYINQPELLLSWRRALTHVANLTGLVLTSNSSRSDQSMLIGQIIKKVVSPVNAKKLFVAKYPVGLDSRVDDLYSLLHLDSSECRDRVIGIWGMGGSGKTVIAKALYNKIFHSFDSSCFLASVREICHQHGMIYLQQQLLSELLMRKKVMIYNTDEGMVKITRVLRSKKVLIVLDDIDKISQVEELIGRFRFGFFGSTILITTRDKHLLQQVNVDQSYNNMNLNIDDAMELFCLHSFGKKSPEEPYAETVDKFVSFCDGLPLALVVLGSSMFGRTIQEWNSFFHRLQQVPLAEIQNALIISYDSLDYQEREIFLDIACFFIGMDIDYVIEILEGCHFYSEIGIKILKEKCFLMVDENKKLRMHNLLRDMGREIVRQASPKIPGKRSRLWNYLDTVDVLMTEKGTDTVEGVSIVSPTEIQLKTKSFARMQNLRLLQMDKVNLHGSFKHISKKIRWICWQDCSLEHLPSELQMRDLVVLEMQNSKMTTLWQQSHQIQYLLHLKILKLSYSKRLTSTPDFKLVPSLTTLILEGCTSLVQIHPSIGYLDSLLVLNLKGCKKITNIPSEICRLRSLRYLNLGGCSNLKELPNLGSMESLRELNLEETTVTKWPSLLTPLGNLNVSINIQPR